MCIFTCTQTHTRMHTHTHTHTHTHMEIYMCIFTCTQTHTHTRAHIHAHTTYLRTHVHEYPCTEPPNKKKRKTNQQFRGHRVSPWMRGGVLGGSSGTHGSPIHPHCPPHLFLCLCVWLHVTLLPTHRPRPRLIPQSSLLVGMHSSSTSPDLASASVAVAVAVVWRTGSGGGPHGIVGPRRGAGARGEETHTERHRGGRKRNQVRTQETCNLRPSSGLCFLVCNSTRQFQFLFSSRRTTVHGHCALDGSMEESGHPTLRS